VLQSVAECCSVLQCVAVCCSVLQEKKSQIALRNLKMSIQQEEEEDGVAKAAFALKTRQGGCSVLQCVAVCCSVLQCVIVYCSVLQCVGGICAQDSTKRFRIYVRHKIFETNNV